MTDYPIPAQSLTRLRTQYEAFTQLVTIVAEAMNLERVDGIDLPKGILIVQDEQPELLGQAAMTSAGTPMPNGVAVS